MTLASIVVACVMLALGLIAAGNCLAFLFILPSRFLLLSATRWLPVASKKWHCDRMKALTEKAVSVTAFFIYRKRKQLKYNRDKV